MNHKNLVCFLHGPGGSGKSAVLELLQLYAREYCNHLNYKYNSEAIVVTAMSGVAATLIGGRTTHSAAHLNKKISNIPQNCGITQGPPSMSIPIVTKTMSDLFKSIV